MYTRRIQNLLKQTYISYLKIAILRELYVKT